MAPEAIIFDVDGTLVDSVDLHTQAWQRAFHEFGCDIAFQKIRSEIGKGGDKLLPDLLPADLLMESGEQIKERRGEIFRKDYLPEVRSFPKVRELFEKIRSEGQKIALATSAKAKELEDLKRIANIEDLVDFQASADDIDRSKPDPDVFHAVLAQLGPAAERAVAVGDTPYDAEGARRAGLRAVGLLSGGFPPEQLQAAGCIVIYRHPAELLEKYENSPLAAAHIAVRDVPG